MTVLHHIIHRLYTVVLKPILFLSEPEAVHARMMTVGQWLGGSRIARSIIGAVFRKPYPTLVTCVAGITFKTPVGLSAGFDYEARLPRMLPSLGFGFGTVGTLTHRPYGGNPRPMLGRLPRSRSLMVNKGFKNLGVTATLEKFGGVSFAYPVGVSIGKTNDARIGTQGEAVADVVAGFQDAEQSGVSFAYYELNISCPNLVGTVDFYVPAHLDELLVAIAGLHLSRPVFIKMPISKTNGAVEAMLDTMVKHPCVTGVIIGNVQTDRNNSALVPEEVARFPKGNFSGKPCQERSDELIRLAYVRHGTQLTIIGCGGVFSAQDAYEKIQAGASLIQLITGLIYEGPQLVAHINEGLAKLLKRDGYQNLAQAVGSTKY